MDFKKCSEVYGYNSFIVTPREFLDIIDTPQRTMFVNDFLR